MNVPLCVRCSLSCSLSLSVGATLLIKAPIFSHLIAAYYLIARLTSSVSSASPTILSLEVPQLELIYTPRPLRTALSRFPNTIRFGSRPPLIRISAPAHKSLIVRNVVSMFSHRVISRARLYEVTRSSGLLLRCAPMMRSNKTRWCTVPSLA